MNSLNSQWTAYFINPFTYARDVKEEEFLISRALSAGCGFGLEVPLHYSLGVTIGLEHLF